MKRIDIDSVLETLVEKLAAIEHEHWAHWQRYMHDNSERRLDGSLLVPSELVRHWDTQIATQYADLTESEKTSDREQVRRYLPVIAAALSETDLQSGVRSRASKRR